MEIIAHATNCSVGCTGAKTRLRVLFAKVLTVSPFLAKLLRRTPNCGEDSDRNRIRGINLS